MKVKSNIWKVYAWSFLISFWLVAPILVPFYQDNGLTSTQIFLVQSMYMVSLLIFEIPAGYLSDLIGRKRILIFSSVMFPVSLSVYAFSHHFTGFLLAEFLMGLAVSLTSGTDSAIIYETLFEARREKEYKKFEGGFEFYTNIGEAVSSILGGLLAAVALRLPFYVDVCFSLLLIPIAISVVEPSRNKPTSAKGHFQRILQTAKYSLKHAKIRTLIIFASLLESATMIGIWSYYLYYENLGVPVAFFGVLFAGFSLFSALGARRAHKAEKKLGHYALYILILPGIFFLFLGLFESMFLIPLIFLNGLVAGFSAPLFKDYINRQIKSHIRTTVLSVTSMAGSLAFIIFSPLFGKLHDLFTLSLAYKCLGLAYILVALISISLMQKNKVLE